MRAENEPTTRPRSRGSRVVVVSSQLQTLSSWKVSSIRQALDSHEQGDLSGSSLLATHMLRDAQIFSGAKTRVEALTSKSGLPFAVEASTGVDDRRSESVRKRVDGLWWTSIPDAQTSAFLRDALFLGVAVGRDDMPVVDGVEVPRIRRLRPNGLRWDETSRGFKYVDGEGKEHDVTPGEHGWILHAPHGPDSFLQGAVRPLGEPFLGRAQAFWDWARFCEKHGLPVLAVKEPFDAIDDIEGAEGSDGSAVRDFYADIRRMRREGVIREPQGQDGKEGWGARWLELQSKSYEAFERFRRELRAEAHAAILGRDPDGGSKGIGGDEASVRDRVRGEYLAADAEAWATTLREQVWKPWVRRNVDAHRPELAPWGRWQTRPPADLAKRADTLNHAADAIEKLDRLGVDTDPVLEEFHLKRRAGAKTQPTQPTPAAPLPPVKEAT